MKTILTLMMSAVILVGCNNAPDPKYTTIPNEVYRDMLAKSKAWDKQSSATTRVSQIEALGVNPVTFYRELTNEALADKNAEHNCTPPNPIQ